MVLCVHKRAAVSLTLASLLTAVPLVMQGQSTGYALPKLLSRSTGTEYVLGEGDQLNLHVNDLEEYTDKTVKISPDGIVDLPLIGQVHASGATLNEFRAEVTRRLAKYVTSPSVAVNLVLNRSSSVSVVGEVNAPGIRELSGPMTLVEVISASGGVKSDAGAKVVVTRLVSAGLLPLTGRTTDSTGMYTTAEIPLEDVLAGKHPANNIQLRAGDVVSIPRASIVYVVGDVHRSGGFPITTRSSMTVIQAVALAEGLIPNNAARGAKILRPSPDGDGKPIEIPVNVPAILAGKIADPPLFAEDILFIPHSPAEAGAKRAAEIALQVATGVLIYR